MTLNLNQITDIALFCRFGGQLEGLGLSGMGHVTDSLWNAYLPKLVNARILVNKSNALIVISYK